MELLDGLTDDQARSPSLLPDWSVGHVLTHLARNGDSVVHLSQAAARRAPADQYPGGRPQRAADIEAGAGRSAAELVDDLVAVHERIDEAWAALDDETWHLPILRMTSGRVVAAAELPLMRRREVVVHTSDLGLPGVDWDGWPDDFVADELVDQLALLPDRLDAEGRRRLLAVLMGRIDEPVALPPTMG